jgi:hypothetical protein
VGVDKAGKQQTAGHIHDLVGIVVQPAADFGDLLAVDEQIRPLGAVARDHSAALEQPFHKNPSVPFLMEIGVPPPGGRPESHCPYHTTDKGKVPLPSAPCGTNFPFGHI